MGLFFLFGKSLFLGEIQMKLVAPKPFLFEAGERAVLLLHGFTGNSADTRMLGRFLATKGYTCHAPICQGHDEPPEGLLTTGVDDWFNDVLRAYEFLSERGHKKIAVAGLSMGGVFSLKLGYTVPIIGIIPMCAPAFFRDDAWMHAGVCRYAYGYKRREKKSDEQIEEELAQFREPIIPVLKGIQSLITDVRSHLDEIYAPTFVVQARHDDVVHPDSAKTIYDTISTAQKKLKWYENSGHVITFDKEREELHEDIYEFLESLPW